MIRKLTTAAVLAAAIVAAPGIASADTNPASTHAHMCLNHPDLCAEPTDHNLDGAFVVTRPPSAWDQFRSIAGHALADFVFGPTW